MINNFIQTFYQYIIILRSGLFDRSYYLLTQEDVRKKDVNALFHFVKFGWKEGRNPSRNFDTNFYLNHYSDYDTKNINPLVHYIKIGKAEGRITNKSALAQKNSYEDWIRFYDIIKSKDRIQMLEHIETFKYKPLISILMPVYNTPEKYLREAIDSVRNQVYTNWELCIADDGSSDPNVKKTLEEYCKADKRIKVTYRKQNGHISASSNSALEISSGEYIGLLDHDDVLREHALYLVVNEINNHPHSDIIYSDEDHIDESGKRYEPYFKPDWNPDLFCSQNMITHFCVFRSELVHQVGGFRIGYEGAQDWDLTMRINEIIPPKNIRHIPFVLYHWRAIEGSTALTLSSKNYAIQAQYKTLQSHFERINKCVEISQVRGEYWRITHHISDPYPKVSIIIPTKNQLEFLKTCINSIKNKTSYPFYEIIIVNNQSDDFDTLNYLENLNSQDNISVYDYNYPFNYSAINNYALNFAKGNVIVFLNNDIEVISKTWLDELVSHATRSEIGAVGALLFYPNEKIQHAGVVLGIGGVAGHVYNNLDLEYIQKRGRACLTQNYSAVTGACMAVEKQKFIDVGGFTEDELPIAFNDIDFCIKFMEKGYRNLWTPYAELYHHESITRGYEDSHEKKARFEEEVKYMLNTWPKYLKNDPAYNLNLSLESLNFSLAFPPRLEKPWKTV